MEKENGNYYIIGHIRTTTSVKDGVVLWAGRCKAILESLGFRLRV